MMNNLNRQLLDIQHQADKIVAGSPTVAEIEDFARYSGEMFQYLKERFDEPHLVSLLEEIPTIQPFRLRTRSGWLALLVPAHLYLLYQERNYIREATELVRTCGGKFASVEFLVRGLDS